MTATVDEKAARKPTILTERVEDRIVVVTLDRPERLNAINHAWIDDFHAVLDDLGRDRETRVVVLTGAGRGFCAGADLKGDLIGHATAEDSMHAQLDLAGVVERLTLLRQPVIAAVNGPAVGGGFALTLGADIRIAASSAYFALANVRIGLSAGECGITWLFPRLVGLSNCFELMLTGRNFDAEEARAIGLVSHVVADEALIDKAMTIARRIRDNSAFGTWMTKDLVYRNLEVASLRSGIALEARTQLVTGSGSEMRRAVAEFAARSNR